MSTFEITITVRADSESRARSIIQTNLGAVGIKSIRKVVENYNPVDYVPSSLFEGKDHEVYALMFFKNGEEIARYVAEGEGSSVVLDAEHVVGFINQYADESDILVGVHNHPNGMIERSEDDRELDMALIEYVNKRCSFFSAIYSNTTDKVYVQSVHRV